MATKDDDPGEEYGTYNCSEFYTDFLSPLSAEVRKGILCLIHEMNKSGAESADAAERYTEMLLRAEHELEPSHIVCEFVVRDMSESLRKFGLMDEAVDLINGRMERIKHEDFGSLLLISRVHDLNGDYRKAAEQKKQARVLAERSDDQIQLCLALAKECCSLWHLQNPEEAGEKLNQCLDILIDCEESNVEHSFPFSEASLRMIDLYKTLGYIHRFLGPTSRCPEYYMKALKIVEKDRHAVVHRFKLEAQVGQQFSRLRNSSKSKEYSLHAYDKIKKISQNETYMIYHTLTVLNAMSRVAWCLQSATKNKFVLSIWQEAYRLGEQYKGQNHPVVARLAADTAFLANKIREHHVSTLYVQRAEATLEYCDSIADINFVKTNVREISDSWNLLGKIYSSRNELTHAERCFKEAIAINTRVYGTNHPRLSRLYLALGYAYSRLQKYNEAFTCFRKCRKITEEFDPNNAEFLHKMKTEMQNMKKLDRSLSSDT